MARSPGYGLGFDLNPEPHEKAQPRLLLHHRAGWFFSVVL